MRATRLAFNPPVRCPAGTPVFETPRGAGCHCAVERNTLTALTDPQSLTAFCFGDYASCTSWQQQKEWEAEFFGDAADDKRGMIDTDRYRADLVEQQKEIEVTRYYHPE